MKEVIYKFLNLSLKNEGIIKFKYNSNQLYQIYFNLPTDEVNGKLYSIGFKYDLDSERISSFTISPMFMKQIRIFIPINASEIRDYTKLWLEDNKHHLTIEKEKIDWL